MKFWDEVFVFTDEAPSGTCENLNRHAKPCKVYCIELGNLAEHLEDTEWTHRWYFAQPRFLPAMASLWELRPNASWYVFGDDDTYFLKEPIVRKLSSISEDSIKVVGKFWCSWNIVADLITPQRHCHPFAQGGAGVAISKGMMAKLGPNLRNCSQQFNDPDFAGSMRFAVCAERIVGVDQWENGIVIESWSDGFHSSPPLVEIEEGNVKEAAASFHRVFHKVFPVISKAHVANYEKESKKFIIDLSGISFSRQLAFLGTMDHRFDYYVGFGFGFRKSKSPHIFAKSFWKPEINAKGEFERFVQEYERGISVILQCDPNVPEEAVYFEQFGNDLGSSIAFNVSCQFPKIELN